MKRQDLNAWRAEAERIYGGHGVRIAPHGGVNPLPDGGAWVEAVVWVPTLEPPAQPEEPCPTPTPTET